MQSDITRAFGFVLICTAEEPRFLLLHAGNTNTWTPPKGLQEPGETGFECALRECREETGLDLGESGATIHTEHRLKRQYIAWGKPKECTYYLATVNRELQVTLSSEHDAFRWVTLAEYDAMKIGKVKNEIRALLAEALAALQSL